MILPIGTVPEGETSPYSATSTMAIDPIYIAPDAMEDFRRAGGVAALSSEARTALDAARASPAVRYPEIRRVKREALALAFQRFLDEEWGHRSVRAAELPPISRGRAGGSMTMRCIPPPPREPGSGSGATGRRRSAIAFRRRSMMRGGRLARKSCGSSTCSGLPSRSGRRHGLRRARPG